MKTITLSLVSLLFLFSCTKKENNATLIKDCTGSYVHINDKDYLICNTELIENIETGTKLSIIYQKTENCAVSSPTLCELYHKNELQVYDRNGTEVFSKNDYDGGWTGGNLSSGVYYYSFTEKRNQKTYKGWVQILK